MFSLVIKNEEGNWISYQGEVCRIIEPRSDIQGSYEAFEHDVHRVVELLYHWVSAFTHEDILFTILSICHI
jgi:hypothetical protein